MNGRTIPLKVRSLVGLIPLLAVEVLDDRVIAKLPGFRKRLQWFLEHRQDLAQNIAYMESEDGADGHGRRLLAIPCRHRLERVLRSCSTKTNFSRPLASGRSRRNTNDNPMFFKPKATTYQVGTPRQNPRPACLAATRTGATCSCFTNISTATPAVAAVPATRPVGPPWPSNFSKVSPPHAEWPDDRFGGGGRPNSHQGTPRGDGVRKSWCRLDKFLLAS